MGVEMVLRSRPGWRKEIILKDSLINSRATALSGQAATQFPLCVTGKGKVPAAVASAPIHFHIPAGPRSAATALTAQ